MTQLPSIASEVLGTFAVVALSVWALGLVILAAARSFGGRAR